MEDYITTKNVQKARKIGLNGFFRKARLGRFQVNYDGHTYIFAEDQKTCITVYPKNGVNLEYFFFFEKILQ